MHSSIKNIIYSCNILKKVKFLQTFRKKL